MQAADEPEIDVYPSQSTHYSELLLVDTVEGDIDLGVNVKNDIHEKQDDLVVDSERFIQHSDQLNGDESEDLDYNINDDSNCIDTGSGSDLDDDEDSEMDEVQQALADSVYDENRRLKSPDITLDVDSLLPLSDEEIAIVRADARRLGAHEFCHLYTFDKRFNLSRLITHVFADQFTSSEMEDIRGTFLARQNGLQLQELWACLLIAVQRFIRRRPKLPHITTIDDVAHLLKICNHIMVISGAGISVSCGIPDFRSKDGIYSRLDDYELDDPTLMFDLAYFKHKPETFYSFAKEIYPSNFKPSPSHMFVRLIEQQGKLLRNYTQNIDNIEELAGIERMIQCHGSFRTARCLRCLNHVPGNTIEKEIFAKQVPRCTICSPDTRSHSDSDSDIGDNVPTRRPTLSSLYGEMPPERIPAIMKPDIVFFGEQLPEEFHSTIKNDVEQVDMLLVIGSSLKVAPVSEILKIIPDHVPQVIINRELLPHLATHFDVHLLGNSDIIGPELCRRAGWTLRHEQLPGGSSDIPDPAAIFELMPPNIYLFEGNVLNAPQFSASDSSSSDSSDIEQEEKEVEENTVVSDTVITKTVVTKEYVTKRHFQAHCEDGEHIEDEIGDKRARIDDEIMLNDT